MPKAKSSDKTPKDQLAFTTSSGEIIQFSVTQSWFVEREEKGTKVKVNLAPWAAWNLVKAHDDSWYQVYLGIDDKKESRLFRRTFVYDSPSATPWQTDKVTWDYEYYDHVQKKWLPIPAVPSFEPCQASMQPQDKSGFELDGQKWHVQIEAQPKKLFKPGCNLIFCSPECGRHVLSFKDEKIHRHDEDKKGKSTPLTKSAVLNAVKCGDEAGWWQLFIDKDHNLFRRTYFSQAKSWKSQHFDRKRSLWVESKEADAVLNGVIGFDHNGEGWQETLETYRVQEAQAALDLIKNKKAVVRVITSTINKVDTTLSDTNWGHEFRSLNEPSTYRRYLKKSSAGSDRTQYNHPRDKKGEFKQREIGIPGRPKDTDCGKKVDVSLIPSHGKMHLFTLNNRVGMLFDEDELETIEEKFVFKTNAYTDYRWHIKGPNHQYWEPGFTIAEVREYIDPLPPAGFAPTAGSVAPTGSAPPAGSAPPLGSAAASGPPPISVLKWTNALFCPRKPALKALFAPVDLPGDRLNALRVKINALFRLDLNLPILVIDADINNKRAPRAYDEVEQTSDLLLGVFADPDTVRHQVAEYLFKKHSAIIYKLIRNNFSKIPASEQATARPLIQKGFPDLHELLNNSDDPRWVEEKTGETSLHRAVERGDATLVLNLCKKGASAGKKCTQGRTPFGNALKSAKYPVVQILLMHAAETLLLEELGPAFFELLAIGQSDLAGLTLTTFLTLDPTVKTLSSHDLGLVFRHLCLAGSGDLAGLVLKTLQAHEPTKDYFNMEEKGTEETLLFRAASECNVPAVTVLCALGANVNCKNKQGVNAFQIALQKKHFSVLEVLLKDAAKSLLAEDLVFAFPRLVLQGQAELAKKILLSWPDPKPGSITDAVNLQSKKTGKTLLHQAVVLRTAATVRFLCEHGANINAKNKQGLTSFKIAMRKKLYSIAEILLNHGASDILSDEELRTLFLRLRTEKQLGLVCLLLAKRPGKIDIDQPEAKTENTLLYEAVMADAATTVSMLCKLGADASKECKGLTPFGLAFQNKRYEILEVLLMETSKPLLVEDLRQAFVAFIEQNDFARAKLLLQEHAVAIKPEVSSDILERLCYDGVFGTTQKAERFELAQFLVKQCKDIQLTANKLYSQYIALHYAVIGNQVSLVKLLCEQGADPTTKSNKANQSKSELTPFAIALYNGTNTYKGNYELAIAIFESTKLEKLVALWQALTLDVFKVLTPENIKQFIQIALRRFRPQDIHTPMADGTTLLSWIITLKFDVIITIVAIIQAENFVALWKTFTADMFKDLSLADKRQFIQSAHGKFKPQDIDTRMADGTTLLQWATKLKLTDVVKSLLEAKADATLQKELCTPIRIAARQQDWTTVAQIADLRVDVDGKAQFGAALVRVICTESKIDLALTSKLIDKGARLNWPNKDGKYALHLAVLGKYQLLVDRILSNAKRKQINVKNKLTHETALHYAVTVTDQMEAKPEIVLSLCLKGANAGKKCKQGFTPFANALKDKKYAIVEILLTHAAKTLLVAELGSALLQLIMDGKYALAQRLLTVRPEAITTPTPKELGEALECLMHDAHFKDAKLFAFAQLLIEKRRDIQTDSKQKYFNFTALHYAVLKNQLELVQSLCELGADCAATSTSSFKFELTPLTIALAKGKTTGDYKPVIALFKFAILENLVALWKTLELTELSTMPVAAQAEVLAIVLQRFSPQKLNIPMIDGNTLLHWAAKLNDAQSIESLIKSGADLTLRNIAEHKEDGHTPIRMAADVGAWVAFIRLAQEKFDPQLVAILTEVHTRGEDLLGLLTKLKGCNYYNQLLFELLPKIYAAAKQKQQDLLLAELIKPLLTLLDKNFEPAAQSLAEFYDQGFDLTLLLDNLPVTEEFYHAILQKIHLSVISKGDAKLLSMLLKPIKDINGLKFAKHNTLLHLVAQHNQPQLVAILIAKKADRTLPDDDKLVPIEIALKHQKWDVVSELAKLPVQEAKDKDQARYGRALLLALILKKFAVAEELLNANAPSNCWEFKGLYPLHYAVLASQPKLVKLILAQKCNINIKSSPQAPTPLTAAVADLTVTLETLQLLLAQPDVDLAYQYNGQTALQIALAAKNYPAVTALLIKQGPPDPKILSTAIDAGDYQLIQILLSHAAASFTGQQVYQGFVHLLRAQRYDLITTLLVKTTTATCLQIFQNIKLDLFATVPVPVQTEIAAAFFCD